MGDWLSSHQAGFRRIGTALGVAAVAAWLLAHASPVAHPVTYDEAFCVYNGVRVIEGQVPFRDFFSFVPAGTYYLLAGPLAAAGDRPETAARYAALAAVFLAWLVAFFTLRRAGGPGFPAGPVSVLLPVCLFPFAPFALHHWFSTAAYFAVIGVAWVLWEGRQGWARWLGAGLLAALAGWCLQTDGVLALALVVLSALGTAPGWKPAVRRLLLLGGGVLGGSALLWSPILWAGGLHEAVRDLVWWPLHNYYRAGNQNDSPLLGDLPARFGLLRGLASEFPQPAGALVALAGALLYVVVLASAAVCVGLAFYAAALILLRRRPPATRIMAVSMATILSLSFFVRLHPTWIHFLYAFVSVFLMWALEGARRSRDSGRRRTAWWVCSVALLAAGVVYHGREWLGRVPEAWEYTDVDRVDRESPLCRSIRSLEFLKPGDTIAVFPTGGNVYLYTYPAAVGYTYFCALEDRYNDEYDHRVVAAQIEERKPKAVFIHRVKASAFLEDGGPVGAVLKRDYRVAGGSPSVVMLVRAGKDP